jgi:hypothetical protein
MVSTCFRLGIAGLGICVLLFLFLPKEKHVTRAENWLSSTVGSFRAVFSNPQSILRGLIAGLLFIPTTIEAGNILAKQLSSLTNADSAGLVLGARVPIILTSRADSVRSRIASYAVAMLAAHARRTKPRS